MLFLLFSTLKLTQTESKTIEKLNIKETIVHGYFNDVTTKLKRDFKDLIMMSEDILTMSEDILTMSYRYFSDIITISIQYCNDDLPLL